MGSSTLEAVDSKIISALTKATRLTKSQPPPTKTLKRSREASVEITDIHPAKRNFRLNVGHISIPRNDAFNYGREEQMHLFYTFCPLDHTNLKKAKQNGSQNLVTYGMHGNRMVEALVLDPDDGVPWQVPKVTLEYEPIDYKSDNQPFTVQIRESEGPPTSPTTLPAVEEMTGAEYEEAVENGDSRVPYTRFTYEFCKDAGFGWVPYKDRGMCSKV